MLWGIHRRRNQEGKRSRKGVPLETGPQAKAERGSKGSEIWADGCVKREAQRSRGRLSIPIGKGEVERGFYNLWSSAVIEMLKL